MGGLLWHDVHSTFSENSSVGLEVIRVVVVVVVVGEVRFINQCWNFLIRPHMNSIQKAQLAADQRKKLRNWLKL